MWPSRGRERNTLPAGPPSGDNADMAGDHGTFSRLRVMLATTCAVGAMVLACNAIIGTRDHVTYDANAEAGSSGSSGTAGSSGSSGAAGSPGAAGSSGTPGSSDDAGGDAGACVNTTSNPLHCGRCNHDCLGGDCNGGVCMPVVLVAAVGHPLGIATLGDDLYVADYLGYVGRINRHGPPAPLTMLYDYTQAPGEEPDSPVALTVDAQRFYFASENDGVYSCPLTGCADGGPTHSFAQAGTDLSQTTGLSLTNDARLIGANNTEFDVAPVTGTMTTLSNTNNAYKVLVDGTNMYFTRAGTMAVALTSGSNSRDVDPLADQYSGHLAASTDRVFWTSANNAQTGHVRSILKADAGGLTSYPGGQADLRGIAVDATNVYWVSAGAPGSRNGALRSCPIAGCTQPTVLLSNLNVGQLVSVDDVAIYIVEYGTRAVDPGGTVMGRVLRLAK